MRTRLLNDDGQMILVIPLVLVLGVSASLLWGYSQMIQRASLSARTANDLNQIMQTVQKRILGVITNKIPAAPPSPCVAVEAKAAGMLGAFRNFEAAPPAPLTLTFNETGGMNPNSALYVNCVVYPAELQTFVSVPPNPSITVTVTLLSQDQSSWSNTVSISIAVQKQTTGTSQIRVGNLTQTFKIQAARLMPYSLVLAKHSNPGRPTPPTLISTSAGATLDIVGSVYDGATTVTPALTSIAAIPAPGGASSLIVEHKLDIRAQNVSLGAAGAAQDMIQVKQVFRNGFNTGVYFEAVLPTEDPGELPHSAWDQSVDYSEEFSTTTPGYPTYAIPDINPAPPYFSAPTSAVSAGFSYVTGPVDPYTAANAVYCGAGGTCPGAPAPGTIHAIPDLATPAKGIATLNSTCPPAGAAVPYAPYPRPFVFNHENQDLIINMGGAGNKFLCGLIRAESVTINVTGAGPVFILGQIISEDISIVGRGAPAQVVLLNPLEQMTALPALTPWVDQAEVVYEFEELATTTAWNFFVPMYTNINPADPTYPTIQPFRPHAALVNLPNSPTPYECDIQCDTSGASGANGIAACGGYSCLCGTPGSSANNAQPVPSGGNTYFCLRPTSSPAIPRYNDELVFGSTPLN